MSSLDRVYGVTMAQKGISDVVSVDFKQIDLKKLYDQTKNINKLVLKNKKILQKKYLDME